MRSARKHLGWYAAALPLPTGAAAVFRGHINALTSAEAQIACVRDSFDAWAQARPQEQDNTREDWKLAA